MVPSFVPNFVPRMSIESPPEFSLCRDEISLEGTPDSRSWPQNHNPQLMMRFHFRDSSYTLRQV